MQDLVRGIGGGAGGKADRVVPPTGFTARLTVFAAGAMAFLAVFALALSLAAGRLADTWANELARTSTIRLPALDGDLEQKTRAVLEILRTTPGVADARVIPVEEQKQLLSPWFGPDLPLDMLPVPRMIELSEAPSGYDPDGLRLRLAAEVPDVVLDDHTRWRRPLIAAAGGLRSLGLLSVLLIAATTAAMITLAANAALAANAPVIQVLRLVGATDAYIARAFVRRFTRRAFVGALAGTVAGMVAVAALPSTGAENSFLVGLGFHGSGWVLPLTIPPLAALVAFAATRAAAFRTLRGVT